MDSNQTFFRLMKYLSPYKLRFYYAIFVTILNRFFDALPEALIGVAIDVVVNQKHSFISRLGIVSLDAQLYFLGFLVFIGWLLESVFEYLASCAWANISYNIQHSLRTDVYDHVQNSSMDFFAKKKTGDIITTLNDDINNLEKFLEKGLSEIIQMIVGTSIVGTIFCYLNMKIAILSLLPVPFIFVSLRYFQKILGPKYGKVRRVASDIASRLFTNISGIVSIKSYVTEVYEQKRVVQESDLYRQANLNTIRISAALIPITRMIIVFGFIIALVLGGIYVLEGQLNVGAYSTMIFMTQRLLWPFTKVAQMIEKFEQSMACANRVFTLLDTATVKYSGSKILATSEVIGEINFKNVSFSYADGIQLFENLNLLIPAGHTVGFVGPTGSGKSTVVKLLLRLYEPTGGMITLDGIAINELTTGSIRKSIGLVSQEHFLFSGTIAENISYGTFSATREEIIFAAQQAEADEFIDDLPQGYDTVIGEQGMSLSGGQRQRISLARAILKNAPIFVFDEATSAVDNETEAEIQRSLEKLAHKKTTIVIAHRLSTVRNANTIYVMDDGQIVESGSHDELLQQDGMYARLWNIQTGQIKK